MAYDTPVIGWNRGGVAEILSNVYPKGLVEAENEKALIASTRPFGYTFDKISATPPRFQPITGVPTERASKTQKVLLKQKMKKP
jgi:hypothetical protein